MNPSTSVLFSAIYARLTVANHRRLRAWCDSHWVTQSQILADATETYLRYLENGQWAITLPADLIQPATEAARRDGLSLPAWIEGCARQALKQPLEVGYTKAYPKKDHPENVTIFCRCGCGTALQKYDKRWRERKYLNGHQPKNGKWLVWNRPKWKGQAGPPKGS